MAVQIPAFTTDQQYAFWNLRKMMSAFATAVVVNPSTDLIVSPSSGLQVQVAAGSAFVQQTVNIEGSSAYNGLYYVINDATANPFNTILAPTVNPRIDQVILRVYDIQEQGLGGTSKGQIEWLPGSENASASLTTMGPGLSNPGATALPANAMQLAYVLQTVGEVSIPASNILDVRPRTHGSTNIPASESRTNVAYGPLTTPDQVAGIIMPTNGLIRVWYQATWQESVSGAARAAIFIGPNQLKATVGSAGDINVQAAGTGSDIAATNDSLTTSPIGLISGKAQAHAGDVTTGQAVGVFPGTTTCFVSGGVITGLSGGPCDIFAAAGTYSISVQFLASSGSVTASNRKLWVQALSLA